MTELVHVDGFVRNEFYTICGSAPEEAKLNEKMSAFFFFFLLFELFNKVIQHGSKLKKILSI